MSKKIENYVNKELKKQVDLEEYLASLATVEEKAKAMFEASFTIRQVTEKLSLKYHVAQKLRLSYIEKSAQVEEVQEAVVEEKKLKKAPRISEIPTKNGDLEPGVVHRFFISAAQDDTPAHEEMIKNMEAYAEFWQAHIFIGGHTYQLGLFEDHAAEANIYDPRISKYLCHDRVQITDSLLYIGSANILPTTANPLAGWTTQNHGNHVVVPHSRINLLSIPRLQGQPPRFAYSTGTCTKPNYTPRASGQKSLFHHTYGFLFVEVDTDGEVFMRSVHVSDNGTFQDLNYSVRDEQIFEERVKAITWGDIHFENLDKTIAETSFGYDIKTKQNINNNSILDTLKPEFQFFHDTLDFRRRNHHNLHDPHFMASIAGQNESVEDEVQEATDFIEACTRDYCTTVIVESNHDNALARWLKNIDGAADAHNAYFWHELNASWHKAIRAKNDTFNVVEYAMRRAYLSDNVQFVSAGQGYQVGGIECGLHGDLGISGSRGTPNQFKRFGRKTSTGHTHSPSISEGAYVAGVSAKLEQGYNKGPTTWAHAHIVQYANGKRTMLHLSADGRCQAVGDSHLYEENIAA